MNATRSMVVAAALAVAASGCGLGPGSASEGEATLTVTRDYGAELMVETSEADPPESETVIRMLDREAEIETRYGGGFVQSIDGVSGAVSQGRASDWFFFVNGVESGRGAAEVAVRGGDRIWWDHRDWTNALRTPAVVGSWPEPFLQASVPEADRDPVEVECHGAARVCDEVADRLSEAGVGGVVRRDRPSPGAGSAPRLVVGPWARLSGDGTVERLADGPAASGVFARFEGPRARPALVMLDAAGDQVGRLTEGAGLVAGLADGSGPVTWVVTGTDRAGVEDAVRLLAEGQLERRYAVASAGGAPLRLPRERGG